MIKLARDTVYRFRALDTLHKFVCDAIGRDVNDIADIWPAGGYWNIKSETIRKLRNETNNKEKHSSDDNNV